MPRVLPRDTDPAAEPPTARPGGGPSGEGGHRYRIDGEIGRGGMGSVFRGHDPDIGREVAIKVLRDDHGGDPAMVRRFVEEAQIGGQLQHPGIAPLDELGTFADRRPLFSMELVKGQTLAALLAERADPADGLPRFVGIFEQICQTVAYAHARGVIHRDLKPSNVMVGGFGEVQVMDWGLAKVLRHGGVADDERAGTEPEPVVATARSASDADRSRAGSVMGTASYMAPEQARGEVDRIDERADVFALGSILCTVLTGTPAFTGRGTTEILRLASRGETADALVRLDASGADTELISLCRDCLAVAPEARPRDAGAIAERVSAYLAGVQKRLHASERERERAVAEARAVEERRKRRWQLGLAASIVASLLIGGIGLAVFTAVLNRQKEELAQANDDLVRQRQRAEADEAAAIDAVKRFRDAVVENPELKDNPDLDTLRKALLKEPLAFFRSLRDRLQADGETTPEALARLASASVDLGRLNAEVGDKQDALTAHREALAIRQRLAVAHPTVTQFQRDLAASHDGLGDLLAATGDPAGARASYESALAIQQRLADDHPESPDYASYLGGTLNKLAGLDVAAHQFAAAADRLREAIAWQKKALTTNPRHPVYRRFLRSHYNNLQEAADRLDDAEMAAEAERGQAELDATDPRLVALDARVAAVLEGEAPKDNPERLALARRAYETRLCAAAARLWAEALESDPSLAEARRTQHAYNAACAAALAAAGEGEEGPKPDDEARSKLRGQVLDWLKSELDLWSMVLDADDPQARAAVAPTLQHWQQDPDLSGVREAEALEPLPEDDREAWQSLWAEVEALRERAEADRP